MKRIFAAAVLMTVMVLLLPRLSDTAALRTPAATDAGSAAPDKTAAPLQADAGRSIRLLDGSRVSEISVYDYLSGVVAAEMPVSFEPEALKAQSVAARSYLQRAIASPKHDGADICADPGCCQAYLSEDELRASWGESYETYMEKIRSAVTATDGEYLSYDGQPVMAAFHSSSDGETEDSSAIWSEVPYLVSVSSPETAETVPDFVSSVECADIDFRDTILYLKPEADMTGDAGSWVGEIRRSASGRIAAVTVGGVEFTGGELRSLFKLRSTDFDLSHAGGKFVFTVRGYGHGVGMSQYGADTMARQGRSYSEILSHYYPGTTLVRKE